MNIKDPILAINILLLFEIPFAGRAGPFVVLWDDSFSVIRLARFLNFPRNENQSFAKEENDKDQEKVSRL